VSETSKALVLFGPDRLEVHEVAVAGPGPGEIRVRIAAAGVCHSDLNVYDRGGTGMVLPAVLGHEAAGVVEDVGSGVTALAPGDHVILSVVPQCGRCVYCAGGQPTLCDDGVTAFGGTLTDGGTRITLDGRAVRQAAGVGAWCEHAVVPATAAVRVDPGIPLVPAALIGCGVVTGYGAAVNVARVGPDDRVAVIGCGGVGLSALQSARIVGVRQIIAVDTMPGKLEHARRLGATDTVEAGAEDPVAAVRDLTGGSGADVTLDFVGTSGTVRQAVGMTRRGGQVVLTGLGAAEWTLPVGEVVGQGKVLRGNLLGMGSFAADFTRLVELYRAGDLLLDEMITRTIGLEDVEAAFAAMRAGTEARSVITFG